jgi:hypothetical protein
VAGSDRDAKLIQCDLLVRLQKEGHELEAIFSAAQARSRLLVPAKNLARTSIQITRLTIYPIPSVFVTASETG